MRFRLKDSDNDSVNNPHNQSTSSVPYRLVIKLVWLTDVSFERGSAKLKIN